MEPALRHFHEAYEQLSPDVNPQTSQWGLSQYLTWLLSGAAYEALPKIKYDPLTTKMLHVLSGLQV